MGKPGSQQSNLQCRIHTHDAEEEGWELEYRTQLSLLFLYIFCLATLCSDRYSQISIVLDLTRSSQVAHLSIFPEACNLI